jgi:hypothetical protein
MYQKERRYLPNDLRAAFGSTCCETRSKWRPRNPGSNPIGVFGTHRIDCPSAGFCVALGTGRRVRPRGYRTNSILPPWFAEAHNVLPAVSRPAGEPSPLAEQWHQQYPEQGLAAARQAATSPATESFPDVYDSIVGALGKLLNAAEIAGIVRPGLSADDVILLLAGLFQLNPATDWQIRPIAFTDSC